MANKDSTTAKNRNRKIRQDNLIDSLAAGGHVQHVIEICDNLCDLNNAMDSIEVARLKATADIKMKLIDKFLPKLKDIEISGGLTIDDIRKKTTKELEDLANGE